MAWSGDYAKHRAEQLAELGYVAFAADIYGDGKIAADTKEAGMLAGSQRIGRCCGRGSLPDWRH